MSSDEMSMPVWHEKHLRAATRAAGVALWSCNVDTDAITMDERASQRAACGRDEPQSKEPVADRDCSYSDHVPLRGDNPIRGEKPFTEDGQVSQFQHGNIYWWPDKGALDLGEVTLRYRGLYCFGESNEPSDADEPYVLMGVVPARGGTFAQPAPVRSPIYDDVDSGDERPDDIELYRGAPYGLAVGVGLMEHDEGDPDTYLGLIKAGADLAGKGVAEACRVLFGAEAAPACQGIWNSVAPTIVSKLNEAMGTDDDLIGKTNLQITAKEMVVKAREPWNRFWGIRYHWETELLTDGDASYKVYFSVDPA
jgi:hypothetical protein